MHRTSCIFNKNTLITSHLIDNFSSILLKLEEMRKMTQVSSWRAFTGLLKKSN